MSYRPSNVRRRRLCPAPCGAALLLLASLAMGQTSAPGNPLTIQGTVRDSAGNVLSLATVSIRARDGSPPLASTQTRPNGTYVLAAPAPAPCFLSAEKAGFKTAVVGPLQLHESLTVDFKLESAAAAASSHAAAPPDANSWNLSDRPDFTVAGIADATSPAGYGSDARVLTSQALAKDAVSLRDQPANSAAGAAPGGAVFAEAEKQLRAVLRESPHSFPANHALGELYVRAGKPAEAIPFLEAAYRAEPAQEANAFELAQAYASAAQYDKARTLIQTLAARRDKAELHHLLGEVDEGSGDPLSAVREYERAARMQPSEPNLFDWGAELLLHRTFEPAVEVFTAGNRLFPRSTRMLVGLGAALYARGSYHGAVQRLCQASDLDPNDSTPYLFMGRMLGAAPSEAADVRDRLARFVRLQPRNPLANYYYALSLRPKAGGSASAALPLQAELFLRRAVELDPKLGEAYLQLGILYLDQKQTERAVAAFEKSVEASPGLADAHYRLAQLYARQGQKVKAQQELDRYNQASKEEAAEAEKQQREIRQFIYTSKDHPTGSPE